MARFIYEREGLTLVEVLVAVAIMSVVILATWTFYLMARESWAVCRWQMPLQRKASVAMEKMVRGVRASGDTRYINGLREAQDIISASGSEIQFKSGIDSPAIIRRFYLDNNSLYYDPDTDPLVTGDEFDIAEKVSSLTFTESGSIVTINLGMQDKVRDTDINVNLSTKVMIRN